MSTSLRQQSWLIVLMILIIGHSGVSTVFAQRVHHAMQSMQTDQALQSKSAHYMQSHSHTVQKVQAQQGHSDRQHSLQDHLKPDSEINSPCDHTSFKTSAQSYSMPVDGKKMSHCEHFDASFSDSAQTDIHHPNLDKSHLNSQMACQECAQQHCQTIISSLNSSKVSTVPLSESLQSDTQNYHYQAQHLLGHWQEILRPPKA